MNFSVSANVRPQILAQKVGEEMVILDLKSGTYFGLDPVGARIWSGLVGGKTLAEIRDAILDQYDVSRDQLEADIIALIQEMTAKELIEQRPSDE